MKKKYELIMEHIQDKVASNELTQGQRLPAIRTMSKQFSCNKSTVIRAYKELEMNHKIYAIPKSGYYLVEQHPLNNHHHGPIDFSQVLPDHRLLPYKEFNHCINRAVEVYKSDLFSYSDAAGLPSLRKVLVKHFSEYQIFALEDNIMITSGAQQALSILTKMPFPNDRRLIAVEQPTYRLIHRMAELNGYKLLGINRDHNGLDLNELERVFKEDDVKFFYTIPRLHNPLGSSYTEKDKKRIIELANKYDVYIVEDDYLVDLDTNKKNMPLYYHDLYNRVIYVKSFSKAFMPGIRIGAVILQEKMKGTFLAYKKCEDLSTSVLAQGALEIFIKSGMYKRHIQKAQKDYKKKMDILRLYLRSIDTSNVECIVPETGFFVWIKVSKRIKMSLLSSKLREKNIYISPGEEFFIDKMEQMNSFRLCISHLSHEEIKRGIEELFGEIQNFSQ
ncbi:aminotransferase-like domain-containing protein [Vallitalea okinawensis]|uniref:aminotransferase-like domain-containing protein n=1 Tax=Vallitalea okinawensis TaxID=2078660 RepID=UPI000CFA979B|nr:PLP-dependent aminotransferase family protein [Vallitalea okinawensis]